MGMTLEMIVTVSITFIKFILLTPELHESAKSRSQGLSTGPMILGDIQLKDHAMSLQGYDIIVEPYQTLRATSAQELPRR